MDRDRKLEAFVDTNDKVAAGFESGFKTARAIAASEAFRKYDWIKHTPGLNSAKKPNLRGMVISGRWATTFNFVEDTLKPVEKVALFAALAANLYHAKDETEKALASNENWAFKSARVLAQVDSVIARTALGGIPAGAHVLALSLGGYLDLADRVGFHRAADWHKSIQSLDVSTTATFEKVTDGDNIYLFISKTVRTR